MRRGGGGEDSVHVGKLMGTSGLISSVLRTCIHAAARLRIRLTGLGGDIALPETPQDNNKRGMLILTK
jgi:hypothetical protein